VRLHRRVAQTIHVLEWDSMKLSKLAEIIFQIIFPNQTMVSQNTERTLVMRGYDRLANKSAIKKLD